MMDDDVERRGKSCLHIKYGATMAQLVAMVLVGLSFKNLCSSLKKLLNDPEKGDITNRGVSLVIFNTLAEKMQNLAMGQYLDIDLPKYIEKIEQSDDDLTKLSSMKTNIERMIMMKTGSLFELSFIWPYVLTNSQKADDDLVEDVDKMAKIANLFGLIFQISDDFEDVEQDLQKGDGINNFVICAGKHEAKKYYDMVEDEFIKLTRKDKILTPEIVEILNYLNKRVNVYYY
jgi:geranylgeranyl pyrophosphate synthase